jgi:hypothetical protein
VSGTYTPFLVAAAAEEGPRTRPADAPAQTAVSELQKEAYEAQAFSQRASGEKVNQAGKFYGKAKSGDARTLLN